MKIYIFNSVNTILFFICLNAASQDSITIVFKSEKLPFGKIEVDLYSPYLIEQYAELYTVENNNKTITIKNSKPEIIKIHNSNLLSIPGKTLIIDSFKNSLLFEVKTTGINNTFLQYQDEFDKMNRLFWFRDKNYFSAKKYLEQVDSAHKKWIEVLTNFSTEGKISLLINKEFKNYILSNKLFLYSLPFLAVDISDDEINIIKEKYFEALLILDINSNIFPNLLASIYRFYVKGVIKKSQSLDIFLKTKYWNVPYKLQKIIASEILKAYTKNEIVLSKEELNTIYYYLCSQKLMPQDKYCDYYIAKTQFNNLNIKEFANSDSLIDINNNTVSFSEFAKNKNIHLYIWASWCAPCVHFIQKLNVEQIGLLNPVSIIFLSLDADFQSWKDRSKQLGFPNPINYLIKGGYNSAFSKKLNLKAIPQLIDINQGKVNMFNISKNYFLNYMLQ